MLEIVNIRENNSFICKLSSEFKTFQKVNRSQIAIKTFGRKIAKTFFVNIHKKYTIIISIRIIFLT